MSGSPSAYHENLRDSQDVNISNKDNKGYYELGGSTDVFSMFLPFPAKWWKTSEDKVGMKMSSLEKIHPWYCLEMFYRQPFAELCFHKNLKILMFLPTWLIVVFIYSSIYLLIILLLNHSKHLLISIYWIRHCDGVENKTIPVILEIKTLEEES